MVFVFIVGVAWAIVMLVAEPLTEIFVPPWIVAELSASSLESKLIFAELVAVPLAVPNVYVVFVSAGKVNWVGVIVSKCPLLLLIPVIAVNVWPGVNVCF